MGDGSKFYFCSTLKTGCRHSFSLVAGKDQDLKVYFFKRSEPPYALGFDKDGLEYRVDLKRSKDGKFPFRVYDDKGEVRDMTKAEALRALQITEKCLSEHRPFGDFGQQLIYLRAKIAFCPEEKSTQSTTFPAEKLTVSSC